LSLKALLDHHVSLRDREDELSYDRPDPLLVASRYKDPYISLVCALFAYGKASLIVKLLDSFDFTLIDSDEQNIRESLKDHYYRFQNSDDIVEFFITLHRLKLDTDLEQLFAQEYRKKQSVLDGINSIIEKMYTLNSYRSRGYEFLIGRCATKLKGGSAMKRWHMFLRWMVRKDSIDLGLWSSSISKRDLLMPLDTHTFNISRNLGLLKRSSCDLQAVIELTEKLKEFDYQDPIKYDFALYRIGQEQIKI